MKQLNPIYRKVLSVFPASKQLCYVSYYYVGSDLSEIAPDELGCAESCTRLINAVFPGVIKINTGTASVYRDLKTNSHWQEISKPEDGCIIIAVTGEGNPKFHGHMGIVCGNIVYSNNSVRKIWDKHLSVQFFVGYFSNLGFPIRYYKLKI